ncbi:centromere protein X [Umbelopsis sp. AD052]|nr:centromere protein X [Umbelopsis sp. AD052]
MEEDTVLTFKNETIQNVFKAQWKDSGTKANKDAIQLSTELLRIFTVEAVHRAVDEANKDAGGGSQTLQVEHLEKILPQLMLDF